MQALNSVKVPNNVYVSSLQQVKEDKPDYIVHDGLCPWGKYVSQIIGIPAICSMTTFAIPSLTMKNIRQLLKSPSDTRLLLLRAADEIQMFKSRSSIQ